MAYWIFLPLAAGQSKGGGLRSTCLLFVGDGVVRGWAWMDVGVIVRKLLESGGRGCWVLWSFVLIRGSSRSPMIRKPIVGCNGLKQDDVVFVIGWGWAHGFGGAGGANGFCPFGSDLVIGGGVEGCAGDGFGIPVGIDFCEEFREYILVGRVEGEVVKFVGIVVEIKEGGAKVFFVAIGPTFVGARADHAGGVVGVACVFGFAEFGVGFVLPVGGVIALQGGPEGVAVGAADGFAAGDVDGGDADVGEVADGGLDGLGRDGAGQAGDEGDAGRAFVVVAFPPAAVVTGHVAVV